MKTPNEDTIGGLLDLDVGLIDFAAKNRKDHDGDKLKSLAASIAAEGLLEPLLVRLHPSKAGRYELIAGERRLRALLQNKAKKAPARLVKSETDAGAARKRLVENMQREDLTPIEEARGYRELAVDHKMTQAAIATLAGVAQPTVANALRLLELPGEVQELVQDGKLTRAAALGIVGYKAFPKACVFIAQYAADNDIPSKQLEQGIPCGDQLVKAGLGVDLYRDLNCYHANDLPKELKGQASVVKAFNRWGNGQLFCLDVPLAKKLVAAKEAKEQAEEKAAAREQGSRSASGSAKQSAAEAAKRRKVIAENKQARLESTLAHEAVMAHIKGLKVLDAACLAVIAQVAFSAHWKYGSSERVKGVADRLGIKMPKGSGLEIPRLGRMKPLDLLRLAAGCICDLESQSSIEGAYPIDESIELVLGEKVTAALKAKAAKQLADAAAAKAAKKAGAK